MGLGGMKSSETNINVSVYIYMSYVYIYIYVYTHIYIYKTYIKCFHIFGRCFVLHIAWFYRDSVP